jgi:hypothetical protein
MTGRLRALAAVALAGALAFGTRAHLRARLAAVEGELSRELGAKVEIGAIDLDLDGTLRLERIALPGVLELESLEVGLSPRALLSGRLDGPELRLRRPRLHLTLDRNGRPGAGAPVARAVRRLGLGDPDDGEAMG